MPDVHTVGKYPSVKTLRRLVLPHAPSPIITSFLSVHDGQQLSLNRLMRMQIYWWKSGHEEHDISPPSTSTSQLVEQ